MRRVGSGLPPPLPPQPSHVAGHRATALDPASARVGGTGLAVGSGPGLVARARCAPTLGWKVARGLHLCSRTFPACLAHSDAAESGTRRSAARVLCPPAGLATPARPHARRAAAPATPHGGPHPCALWQILRRHPVHHHNSDRERVRGPGLRRTPVRREHSTSRVAVPPARLPRPRPMVVWQCGGAVRLAAAVPALLATPPAAPAAPAARRTSAWARPGQARGAKHLHGWRYGSSPVHTTAGAQVSPRCPVNPHGQACRPATAAHQTPGTADARRSVGCGLWSVVCGLWSMVGSGWREHGKRAHAVLLGHPYRQDPYPVRPCPAPALTVPWYAAIRLFCSRQCSATSRYGPLPVN